MKNRKKGEHFHFQYETKPSTKIIKKALKNYILLYEFSKRACSCSDIYIKLNLYDIHKYMSINMKNINFPSKISILCFEQNGIALIRETQGLECLCVQILLGWIHIVWISFQKSWSCLMRFSLDFSRVPYPGCIQNMLNIRSIAHGQR